MYEMTFAIDPWTKRCSPSSHSVVISTAKSIVTRPVAGFCLPNLTRRKGGAGEVDTAMPCPSAFLLVVTNNKVTEVCPAIDGVSFHFVAGRNL
jgi:hypothetical protein